MSVPSRALVAAFTLAGLVGCTPPTQCTVTNHSAATLTNVVISGSTFSVPVSDLAPGSSRVVTLSPRGEEGTLTVAFHANGHEYRQSEPTYFEAEGYDVRVTISPEFHVSSQIGVLPSRAPTPTRPTANSAS